MHVTRDVIFQGFLFLLGVVVVSYYLVLLVVPLEYVEWAGGSVLTATLDFVLYTAGTMLLPVMGFVAVRKRGFRKGLLHLVLVTLVGTAFTVLAVGITVFAQVPGASIPAIIAHAPIFVGTIRELAWGVVGAFALMAYAFRAYVTTSVLPLVPETIAGTFN